MSRSKNYNSKFTGQEIDIGVSKAQQLPELTTEDNGKALIVDGEGSIETVNSVADFSYQTEVPEKDNKYGIKIVRLTEIPSIYYKGYIYFIEGKGIYINGIPIANC